MVGTFRHLPPIQGAPHLKGWVHGGSHEIAASHVMVPYWFTSIVVRREWTFAGEISDVRLRVHGPQPVTYTYATQNPVELMGVEIAPEFSAPLIRISNDDLAGQLIDWPEKDFEVAVRLAANGASAETVAVALMHAVAQLGIQSCKDSVEHSIGLFRKHAGAIRVRTVCSHLDLCERAFRREFKSRLGISAKNYSRLLRANELVAAADRIEKPDWADLAYRFGYFDQAHMSNDLRQLTGHSPQNLHVDRRNEAMS